MNWKEDMRLIEYGEREISHLSKRDKKLGAFIERTGFIEREIRENLFESLATSIINQQISNSAAFTVMGRFHDMFPAATPEAVDAASVEEIQKIGVSMRKASYIKGLSSAAACGELDIEGLRALPDDEVAKALLPIKGIGIWTVEMFLIFSLGRPDVVSFGDFAIRKGMMNLYGLKRLDRAKFDRYRKRYAPYGTTASLYLWEAAVTDFK
ncbi:MAG: DNA-3-methyladenine glycosylase 2 family protein [Synergistaceae bacterium]|nr:DNA-3-methyladenine glycosylase 2 family protein [Synergistaceae bacterium]